MPTHMMFSSLDPETMLLPSGVKATLLTASECPSSLDISTPVTESHTLHRGWVGGVGVGKGWLCRWSQFHGYRVPETEQMKGDGGFDGRDECLSQFRSQM